MHGRSWLVRRAEGRLGPELGALHFVATSSKVYWKALLPCLAVGFAYGAVGEFVTPRSSREPGVFSDVPMYLLVSTLTGLLLWCLTLLMSFRKLLVFDGGLAARIAQKHTTVVFRWSDIDSATIKAVTTAEGTTPSRMLAAGRKASLGVSGRNALVFRTGTGFWLFESRSETAPLVLAIQQAMLDAGVPGAARVASRALPPAVVSSRTSLD
ncbi:hypothetical protein [Arthrobacter celericrescens]|uniref:hypothetical protein n=1 Tax=Arthrobacter celericrescens TaxID=2320851 RepID=UPI000EA2D73F|nr:hypothetical protein [Arthrobacter celericrescens]